jgi:hypothetical protein
MQVMDQEMDEYKTPSRNNTQNMVLEDDELSIMTRNNTQQTDQDMIEYRDETPFSSQNNTQQTDQGIIEDDYQEMNNVYMFFPFRLVFVM